MNIKWTCTSDAAPVQYEGTIDEKYFYFRARLNVWSFTVAETLDEAIDGAVEGAIGEKGFYFQARSNEWTSPATETLETTDDSSIEGEIFMKIGNYGDKRHPYKASYMSHEEAEYLIRVSAEEYLAERNRYLAERKREEGA